jgi:hypothetical protein
MPANADQFPIEKALDRLHTELGYRRLNKFWAKLEIVFGLLAAGSGLLVGAWAVSRSPEPNIEYTGIGLILFILGGYLALAGSRSHLYQSNNRLAAYLAEIMRHGRIDAVTAPESAKRTVP